MSTTNKRMRICIVGAGPSGMSLLYHFDKLQREGHEIPEITCYDKQEKCGGLWNFSWRTGTDEHGERVPNSMYRYLFSNGPKEASLEYPDYSFEEHFGKPIGSFPPRAVLYDYQQARWNRSNLQRFVQLRKAVRNVTFDDKTNLFTVEVLDMREDRVMEPETYDYVLIASGHFSVPNIPYFEGMETFHGRVMHSHDFRNPREFAGKNILCVGSSYSAEDVATQSVKYGAESAIISYRNRRTAWKWPERFSARPLLTKVHNKTCYFKDGTTAEIDAIILCTGYLNDYKYLEDKLRLNGPNILYPPHLYKGVVWQKSGNNKLLYVGCQDQYYTYTMFDAQAHWVAKYVIGKLPLPDKSVVDKDWKMWHEKEKATEGHHEKIQYQSDYIKDLTDDSGYGYNIDVTKQFCDWEDNKVKNIMTFRDQPSFSTITGKPTPVHHTPFMENFDDTLEAFLAEK